MASAAGRSLRLLALGALVVDLAACGSTAGSAGSHRAAPFPPPTSAPDRGPASTVAPTSPSTVTIAAVGDTDLGTTGDLAPSPGTYLDAVEPYLQADIGFFNLEGTLSTDDDSKCGAGSTDCFAFQDPPSDAAVYRSAGFTVANSANNHSHDDGPLGVAQTSAALRAAGIVQAGLPGQIGVVTVGRVEVAFVDFAPYPTTNNLLDYGAARSLIDRAKGITPVIVVYMHAGAEGADADQVTGQEEYDVGEDRGNAERFAHDAIDDGASVVIASGPHVLRGMEIYRDRLIAYSLGDFAGYDNFATDGDLDLSAILHLRLSSTGRYLGASWTSLVLSSVGQPSPDPIGAAAAFVNGLSKEDFGSSAALIDAGGSIRRAG